jgi:hypothetical protein
MMISFLLHVMLRDCRIGEIVIDPAQRQWFLSRRKDGNPTRMNFCQEMRSLLHAPVHDDA